MTLDVVGLHFDYSDRPLLQDVTFSLEAGRLLHVRGPNGVGKTTLLKLLTGLLSPTCGEIRYRGKSITDDQPSFQQNLCYLGHKAGVSQRLTVREHCRFDVIRPANLPSSLSRTASFDDLMKRFSLLGLDDVLCGLLSAGQRRRVGLLRLLMSEASLWILDEPLVALDSAGVDVLMDCFSEHLDKGRQIVMTSHQEIPLLGHACQDYHL